MADAVQITSNIVSGSAVTSDVVESSSVTASVVVGGVGPAGAAGAAGQGVPTGGSTNQVLAKASATNYDTAWVDASSDSGQIPFLATVGTADADYITDGTADHVQIQQALDAANAAGGGTVFIKAGTYTTDTALTIYAGTVLRGAGMQATLIQTSATSGVLPGTALIKTGTSDDYITISDMELLGQGEGDTSGYGIYMPTGVHSFITLERLYIHQFPNSGIYISDAILSSFEDLWVRDNGQDGIFLEIGTTCHVKSIYASGNNRSGIHMKTHTSSVIDNCAAEYNTLNFWLESTGNVTLNSPYVELSMRGDGGAAGVVAAYRIQSSQNITINSGYSNSFAYLSGVPAYHLYITGSDRILINAFRGKALSSAEGGSGEAPTNTVYVDASSDVHANNINFTDLTGGGQSGTFASEVKSDGGFTLTSLATAYSAKTANYTATATDSVIDCTSGTFTVTLPTAVSITGRQYVVKNSGSGIITVNANGSETIDGTLTIDIASEDSVTIVSNGANWIII